MSKPVDDRTLLVAPPVLDPDEDGVADEDGAPGEEDEEEEGPAPVDDAKPVDDADADADADPELEPEPVLPGTVTLTVTLMVKSGTFHEYELSETAEVFRIHTLTLFPAAAATMSNLYEMLEAESCEALILRQLEHTTSLEKSKPVTAYIQSRKRVKAVVALSKVMPFTED